jgi:hypothetical protein
MTCVCVWHAARVQGLDTGHGHTEAHRRQKPAAVVLEEKKDEERAGYKPKCRQQTVLPMALVIKEPQARMFYKKQPAKPFEVVTPPMSAEQKYPLLAPKTKPHTPCTGYWRSGGQAALRWSKERSRGRRVH